MCLCGLLWGICGDLRIPGVDKNAKCWYIAGKDNKVLRHLKGISIKTLRHLKGISTGLHRYLRDTSIGSYSQLNPLLILISNTY